jgi:hypothetical protein
MKILLLRESSGGNENSPEETDKDRRKRMKTTQCCMQRIERHLCWSQASQQIASQSQVATMYAEKWYKILQQSPKLSSYCFTFENVNVPF